MLVCLGLGKPRATSPARHNSGMVVPAYNLCIWEAKAGRSGIKGHRWPHIKSEASMIPFLSNTDTEIEEMGVPGHLRLYTEKPCLKQLN